MIGGEAFITLQTLNLALFSYCYEDCWSMSKRIVVAIGGNSLIKDKAHKTVPDQYAATEETVPHIVDLVEQGWDVAITHGNGPQVGFILRRS